MKKNQKLVFQEDDALIHGQDPDYLGVHGWWAEQFPNHNFRRDWDAAKRTEVDMGDCFSRMIKVQGRKLKVVYSSDGYAVYETTTPKK